MPTCMTDPHELHTLSPVDVLVFPDVSMFGSVLCTRSICCLLLPCICIYVVI